MRPSSQYLGPPVSSISNTKHSTIKPGGWIEFQEQHFHTHCDDGTMPENYILNEWWDFVGKGLAVFGRDLDAVLKMGQHLRDAGFVNVEERTVKIPIGHWPKNKKLRMAGLYCRASIEDGLEGLSLGPLTRGKSLSL
jgi:hypothetical protein